MPTRGPVVINRRLARAVFGTDDAAAAYPGEARADENPASLV
jgi:hypothetical protein